MATLGAANSNAALPLANGGTGGTTIPTAQSGLGFPFGLAGAVVSAIAGQYSSVGGNTTSNARAANTEVCIPIIFANVPSNAIRIGAWVNGTVANAVTRLGIRSDAGNAYPYPGSVLVDAGTIDCHTSTGWQEIVINQPLTAGVIYWLSATNQTANSNMITTNAVSYSLAAPSAAYNGAITGYSQTGVSGALGTFSSTITATSLATRVALGF